MNSNVKAAAENSSGASKLWPTGQILFLSVEPKIVTLVFYRKTFANLWSSSMLRVSYHPQLPHLLRHLSHWFPKSITNLSTLQYSSVAYLYLTLCDPHGLKQARLPCPSPTPRPCSNSCPSSQWCHPTISSSVVPIFFCLLTWANDHLWVQTRNFTSDVQRPHLCKEKCNIFLGVKTCTTLVYVHKAPSMILGS